MHALLLRQQANVSLLATTLVAFSASWARPVASIPAVSSRQCSSSGLTELDATVLHREQ